MADFFIRRPIVAMVIAILTVIVGAISLKRLPNRRVSAGQPYDDPGSRPLTAARPPRRSWNPSPRPSNPKSTAWTSLLYMQSFSANDGKGSR